MKILHVITSLSPKQGGTRSAVLAMAEAAAQQGAVVHIAATDDNGHEGHLPVSLSKPLEENGVTFWYFHRQTRFYGVSISMASWLASNLPKYDLIHIHGLFIFSSLPAAYYARKYRIPYIVSPHGVLNQWGMRQRRSRLKRFMLRLLEKPIVTNHAAALHFTCEQEQIEAAQLGISQKSIMIPLGIALEPYYELPSAEHFLAQYSQLKGQKVLLFLSRLDPKKGLDLLLPAFAEVLQMHPQTALVIAGDGHSEFVSYLQSLAHTLNIEQKIIWPGFLSGKDKLSALAAADIFVLPSYSENFGIVVVESLGAGIPLIISNRIGIYREIAKAQAGQIVSCEIDDVVKAMSQLLAEPELCQQLGKNGRELAANFSLENMGSLLISAYQSIRADSLHKTNLI